LVDKQCDSRHCRYDEPTGIEYLESEVEGHFLSIVTRNEIQGLHVVVELACKHPPEEALAILGPASLDLDSEVIMKGEMVHDDANFFETIEII
jgi:hypothetical protein